MFMESFENSCWRGFWSVEPMSNEYLCSFYAVSLCLVVKSFIKWYLDSDKYSVFINLSNIHSIYKKESGRMNASFKIEWPPWYAVMLSSPIGHWDPPSTNKKREQALRGHWGGILRNTMYQNVSVLFIIPIKLFCQRTFDDIGRNFNNICKSC